MTIRKRNFGLLLLAILMAALFVRFSMHRGEERSARDNTTASTPSVASVPNADATPCGHGHEHASSASAHPAQPLADDLPALVAALSNAQKGSAFSFNLPGGQHVSGTVNVVTLRPDGTRYVGGLLEGWQRASFFFSLNKEQQAGGEVLIYDDEKAYVLGNGSAFATVDPVWQEKPLGDVICHPYTPAPDNNIHASLPTEPEVDAAPVTPRATPVPAYESRPGASIVLLLDFNGAVIEGTSWNTGSANGKPIIVPPPSFTDTQISLIWQRVSEDYAPFNINVTTDSAAYGRAAYNRRIRCIFTPDGSWYGSAGGVAYVGVVGSDGDMWPCWVFNSGLDGAAEAASHEIGHTFGLRHHGQTSATGNSSSNGAYYYGHGGSSWEQSPAAPMSWGAIMGAAYYTSINQWSRGEYPLANNTTQNDINVIATRISSTVPGYANDGIGGTRDSAVPLSPTGETLSGTAFQPQAGVITSSADANYHRLVLPEARTVALMASPAVAGSRIPNINISLEIQNADGGTLVVFGTGQTPLATTYETLSASGSQALASGTYFIKINGYGFKDPAVDGFSNYGSIGQYVLTGGLDTPLADSASPAITTQPADATFAYPMPASITLSVAASGAAPLTYLWHKGNRPLVNNSRVSGVTTATLAVSNPGPEDAGDYFVLVTDADGRTLASHAATVAFTAPSVPVITEQPADIIASSSFSLPPSLAFSVAATSAGPVYYQWLRDGIPLNNTGRYSGVTTGTLEVASVVADDSQATFSARVYNAGGGVHSDAARLVLGVTDVTHWIGSSGTVGEWINAANWSDSVIPSGTDTISINNGGTARIGADVTATGSAIWLGQGTNESGGIVVESGGVLTVSGSVIVGASGRGALSIVRDGGVVAGAYAQNANSTLSIVPVAGRTGAYVIAQTAVLSGTFIVTGYAPSGTLLHADGGISGDFTSTNLLDADYVSGNTWISGSTDYVFTQTLAWTRAYSNAHGTFTVAQGVSFDTTIPLMDNTTHTYSGWDGKSLLKKGAGTLIVAEGSGYTGTTTVREGMLTLGGTLGGPVINDGALLLAGGAAPQFGALTNNGALDFNSPGDGPFRTLTLASLGGSGMLRMKFDPDSFDGDKLVVLGDAAGTHAIDMELTSDIVSGDMLSLSIVTVGGSNEAVFSGTARSARFSYSLQAQPNGTFIFVRSATTLYWDANGANPWNSPANWNVGVTPSLNDTVYINNSGTAIVGSGVVARSNLAYVGYSTGSAGGITVAGNGQWETNSSIRIGYYGKGALDIVDNGTVRNNSSANIGYYASGSGLVTVRDNACWETTGVFYAGYYGTGKMSMSGDSMTYNKSSAYVAYMDTGTGEVIVSDNSLWKIGANLYVGGSGAGKLTVTNKGIVQVNTNSYIGNHATAVGEVMISGSALWDTGTNYLYVGSSGTGNLVITDSGTVVSRKVSVIGSNATGVGSVIVKDNAIWESDSTIFVGNHGIGKLTIEGTAIVYANSLSQVGSAATGVGTVTVSGSALLKNKSTLYVGLSGSGKLMITDSGTVSSDGNNHIGYNTASDGSVVVSGSALWDIGATLRVGYSGTGRLEIVGDGRVVAIGNYTQNALSTLTVELDTSRVTDTLNPELTAPLISAGGTATLSGTLRAYGAAVAGINSVGGEGKASQLSSIPVLRAAGGITGDFDLIEIDGFIIPPSLPDYIRTGGMKVNEGGSADTRYDIGFDLAWRGAAESARGTFTVETGETFEVDVPLGDRTGDFSANSWDGKSLTKVGAGTLVLSAANTYTGTTTVQAGVLAVGGTLGGHVVNSGTISLFNATTLRFNGTLTNSELIDFNSPSGGSYRALTVNALAGSGTMRMTINPADGTGDRLIIANDASGAQEIAFTLDGTVPAPGSPPLNINALQDLIAVQGANTITITGGFTHGGITYTLQQQPDGAIILGGGSVLVAFDAQEGTVDPASKPVIPGQAYGTLPTPAKTNNTFGGWWTATDDTGEQITDTSIVPAAANHTLYAKWTPEPVTITFDAQGGTVDPASKTATPGQAYGTLPAPTKPGNAFDGWWTATDGTGEQITDTSIVSAEATDHTLYAKWVVSPVIEWALDAGSQTVQDGATATFAVSVTAGSAPLTYKWYKDDTPIDDATSETYTTPATLLVDDGAVFKVEVGNSGGTAFLNATLTVVPSPATLAQTLKTQLETPGAGTVTINGTIDFSLVGGVTVAAGKTIVGADATSTITGGLTLATGANDIIIRGVNFTDGTLVINGANDVSVTNCTFTDAPVSITGGSDNVAFSWNKFEATPAGTGSAMTISNAGASTGIILDHNLWGDGLKKDMPAVTSARVLMNNNYIAATGNTTATVVGGGAQILSVRNTYESVNNPVTKQSGGLLRAIDSIMTATTGTEASGDDEVFVPSSSYVTDNTPAADIAAHAGNTAGENSAAPAQLNATASITATVSGSGATSSSAGAIVPTGGGFTLTANGSGVAPTAHQWYRDNFAIGSAVSATHIVTNASTAEHAGVYSVALTAPTGEIVNSGAFAVTVNAIAAPIITAHPVSKTITVGGSATFIVTATGESLAYQWMKGGAPIDGATNASYTITNAQQSHAGSYTVRVSNAGGSVTSTVATLTANTSGGNNTGGNDGGSSGGGGGGGAPSLWLLAAFAVMLGIRQRKKSV